MFLGISWNGPPVFKKAHFRHGHPSYSCVNKPQQPLHPPKKHQLFFLSHDLSVQTPWGFVSLWFLSLHNYLKLFIEMPGYFAADSTEKNLAVFLFERAFPCQGKGSGWIPTLEVTSSACSLASQTVKSCGNKQRQVLMESFCMSWLWVVVPSIPSSRELCLFLLFYCVLGVLPA